jgi:hypothetical protein
MCIVKWWKKVHRRIQNMPMFVHIQLLALEHCWNISTGSCLTTHLTALISLGATIASLHTWRTGWDHSTSTVMSSWWKVLPKRGLSPWANYTDRPPLVGEVRLLRIKGSTWLARRIPMAVFWVSRPEPLLLLRKSSSEPGPLESVPRN